MFTLLYDINDKYIYIMYIKHIKTKDYILVTNEAKYFEYHEGILNCHVNIWCKFKVSSLRYKTYCTNSKTKYKRKKILLD